MIKSVTRSLFVFLFMVCISKAEACAQLTSSVELSETEVKYLIADLTKIPQEILTALRDGQEHPLLLRRGFVQQEYLAVTDENLRELFAEMRAAQIPFGSAQAQAEFLQPGIAREIRWMSKSLKINGKVVEIIQAAVKGSGSISVPQIENPESLTAKQTQLMVEIFQRLRSKVQARILKAYFEVALPQGRSVEVDIFLNVKEGGAAPIFINGEVEFHGNSKPEAIQEAIAWQSVASNVPPYFARELTQSSDVKSRDIAFRGPPLWVTEELRLHVAGNEQWTRSIVEEFKTWSRVF